MNARPAEKSSTPTAKKVKKLTHSTEVPGRAPEGIESSCSVPSVAERVVNLPGPAIARRRAWSRYILDRDTLTMLYLVVWIASLGLSVAS